MTNNITIKSGIDINSEEFINYYNKLKSLGIRSPMLDFAVSCDSEVLKKPLVFDEKDYDDYKIDDISFIRSDGNIIGHMVYTLEKTKPTISLSLGLGNHLDMERVKQLRSNFRFYRTEYFCDKEIKINDLIVKYLSNRTHRGLEYKGSVPFEHKIHIKK